MNDKTLEICNGNKQAAIFVDAFVSKCHLMDDIVDKDQPVDDKRIVRIENVWLEQLLVNPWVKANSVALWPHIVTGMNAWLDSNRWAESKNSRLREDAWVLKSTYHELVWWVAYLCGGREHMENMTTKYREFDKKGEF